MLSKSGRWKCEVLCLSGTEFALSAASLFFVKLRRSNHRQVANSPQRSWFWARDFSAMEFLVYTTAQSFDPVFGSVDPKQYAQYQQGNDNRLL